MSDQPDQGQHYQPVPPTSAPNLAQNFPPRTPAGQGFPPAGYPPGAASGQHSAPDATSQPGLASRPAPPFSPNEVGTAPPQLPFAAPRYRFYFSEAQMRRYFHPSPRRPLLCMLGGIICLFVSPIFLLLFFLPVLAGLTLLAVGLGLLIFEYASRPGEEQYQGWLEERQRYLVDASHQKVFFMNTTIESDQLFVFRGFVEPGTPGAGKYKEVYRKASRFGPHYNVNTSTIIFLAKDNIVVLSSDMNALDQMWSTTEVRYYYYEHVSGVLIADKVLEVTTPQAARARLRAQAFGLLIDSGDIMGSNTVMSMHIETASGAVVATRDNDDLIQRLISLLKVHKMSHLAALRENEALS